MIRSAALAACFVGILGFLFVQPARCVPQGSTLDQARAEVAQGHYDQAARLFGEVLRTDPNNIDALGGLVDSLVATGHWHDSLPALQHLVQLQPNNAERVFQLGQMDSWQPSHRAEALELLKRATDLKPTDAQYEDTYAEVLSWSESGRAQALEHYKKALAIDPNNARALAGEAQLLAWSGHSSEAMELYEKVLQQDPNNVAALRGKAEILDWRGQHAAAMSLYEQAHGLAPSDSATMFGLAQTEYESGEYTRARADLAEVKGIDTPEFRELRRNVNHALGTYMELGYGLRRDGKILDYDSVDALVSTPLGGSNRLSALYQPFLFRTQARNFNSNYYALMLDSQPDENVVTHAQIAGRTYPGVSSQIEGAFDATFKVRPSFKLYAGVERESDQESLVSTLGAETSGVFVGQVETNLGHIGGSYANSQHNYDLSVTYTDGAYTGENLAPNRRWGVDGNFGKSIRGNHPYIRIAYGVSYLRFDHDADFAPGSGEPARVTGGYYSPTRFLLNYGQIFLSANLGRRVKWDMGGMAGAQNAETTFASFSNTQFASTFSTHMTWNVSENNDLRLGYDYLNTFNAFHRHLFVVAWRHYF
ncbi:MAG TPA: tetratricopeptide repeat protein [Candidatus Dormibacteraeota bacterium]|nr:tetratricopeptide repeat protein [Candidatus Dormibacteraeota bacterium]